MQVDSGDLVATAPAEMDVAEAPQLLEKSRVTPGRGAGDVRSGVCGEAREHTATPGKSCEELVTPAPAPADIEGPRADAAAADQPTTPGKRSMDATTIVATELRSPIGPAAPHETPEKDRKSASSKPEGADAAALCQQLYFRLLRALFHDLDFYVPETGMLDPRKQLLVYHHAAMIFELRKLVIGALRKEGGKAAELPERYQRVLTDFVEAETKAGSLPQSHELREKFVFGHENVIKFVEPSSLPKAARGSCVILREKPHCTTDVVKAISSFRDLIKFRSTTNPLTLIDETGLGLVVMVEGTTPRAFIVASPLLRAPQQLEEACAQSKVTLSALHTQLGKMLTDMIASEADAWRAFVQRRASIMMKGSLNAIAQQLRKMPVASLGSDAVAADTIRELEEQLEQARQTLKEREAEVRTAKRRGGLLNAKLKQTQGRLDTLRVEVAAKVEAPTEEASTDTKKLKDRMKALSDKFKKAKGKVRKLKLKYEKSKQSAQEGDLAKLQECTERAEAAERAVAEQAEELERLRRQAGNAPEVVSQRCALAEREVLDLKSAAIAMRSRLEASTMEAEQFADSNLELLHSVAFAQAAAQRQKEANATMRGVDREVKAAKVAAAKAQAQLAVVEAKAKEQLQAKAEVLREQQNEVSRAAARADAAVNAAAKAHGECEIKAAEAETLRSMNIGLRAEMAKCKDEVIQANGREAAASQLAKDAEQRAAGAVQESSRCSAELKARDHQLDAMRASAEAEAAELRAQIAAQTREIEASRASTATLQATLEAKTRLCEALTEEAQVAAARLRAELAVKTNEAKALEQAVLSLRLAARSKDEAAETARVEAARAKGELAVAASQAEQLREANVDLRAAAAEVREEVAQSAAREHAASQALEAAQDAEAEAQSAAEELRAQLAKAEDALRESTKAAEQATAAAAQAASDLIAAERREAEARAREAAQRAESTVKDGELDAMRAFVADLQRERQAALDRAAAADERVTALERQVVELPALRADLQVKAEAMEQLRQGNIQLRTELADATASCAASKERSAMLERSVAEMSELKAKVASATKDSEAKAEEAARLSARIRELSDEVAKARAFGGSTTEAVAAAKAEAERSASSLREEAAMAAARLQVTVAEMSKMTEDCLRARAQQSLAEKKLAVATSTLKSVAETSRKLRAQVAALKAAGAQAASDDALFAGVWSSVESRRRRRYFPRKRRLSSAAEASTRRRKLDEAAADAAPAEDATPALRPEAAAAELEGLMQQPDGPAPAAQTAAETEPRRQSTRLRVRLTSKGRWA